MVAIEKLNKAVKEAMEALRELEKENIPGARMRIVNVIENLHSGWFGLIQNDEEFRKANKRGQYKKGKKDDASKTEGNAP